jgi:hypothetical protein
MINLEELLLQANFLLQEVQEFTINQEERYSICDSGVYFATSGFTAKLIKLVRATQQIFTSCLSNPNEELNSILQQVLFTLHRTLKEAENIRTIFNYSINDVQSLEIIEQIKVHLEKVFITTHGNLEKFIAYIANENRYLLTFRYCFPIDPSVYNKILSTDASTEADIKICEEINLNMGLFESTYQSIFNLSNPHKKIDKRKLSVTSDNNDNDSDNEPRNIKRRLFL